MPGVALEQTGAGFLVAALDRGPQRDLPPVLAALRLPFMVAHRLHPASCSPTRWLLHARRRRAAGRHPRRLVRRRAARRAGDRRRRASCCRSSSAPTTTTSTRCASPGGSRAARARRSAPTCRGSSSWRSTGSRCRSCATRCATAARRTMARWIAEDGYRLAEWETDLSSQTGASQAGILLGSNEDIPAFRWVEKETRTHDGLLVAGGLRGDRAPPRDRHRPAGRRRREPRQPALRRGRGGDPHRQPHGGREARPTPATARSSPTASTSRARSCCSSGRSCSSVTAAARAARRDVRPRGHRGGIYPFMRGAMCVIVRDLIVFGVLTDMMRGRPAVYATFSSYDEVAHHSGLERADTLEALRKLDQQFARIERARRYAPRPYEIVVLSDHGQTQGATFKQRNGYGLDELVERSLSRGRVAGFAGGDEQHAMVGHAVDEATRPQDGEAAEERRLRPRRRRARLGQPRARLPDGETRRLTLEEIEDAPPGPDAGAARAPAHRLAARALRRARRRGARPGRRAATSTRAGSRATTRWRRSRPPRPRTCCAPTASPTSPTSWSAASTTRARRGLRVRGADLVPRRARRPADARRSSSPAARCRSRGADHRRRGRARRALAAGAACFRARRAKPAGRQSARVARRRPGARGPAR